MKIGMLWFDNSGDPIPAIVQRAADYYQEKYGRQPNCCYMSPAQMEQGISKAGEVQLHSSQDVMPAHFWIGVEDDHR